MDEACDRCSGCGCCYFSAFHDTPVPEPETSEKQAPQEKKRRDGKTIDKEEMSRGLARGIEALIIDNLEENKSEEQILQKIVKRFSLNREDAVIKYRENQ